MKSKWVLEVDNIEKMVAKGYTVTDIGRHYSVSKQRMYQIMTKFGIKTGSNITKNFLRDMGPEKYWLNDILNKRKVPRPDKMYLLENLDTPSHCPIFGIEIHYDGTGYKRNDSSPSLDRIYSNKGYEIGNLQVISWRANRIKNDSTVRELRLLADYMETVEKRLLDE